MASFLPEKIAELANLPVADKIDEHHSDPNQRGTDYQAGVLAGYQATKGSVSQVTEESEFNRGFKMGQAIKKGADPKNADSDEVRSGKDYEQGLKDGLAAQPGSVSQVTEEVEYNLGFKEGQKIMKNEGGQGQSAIENLGLKSGDSNTGSTGSTGFSNSGNISNCSTGNTGLTSGLSSTAGDSVYGHPDETGKGPMTKPVAAFSKGLPDI